MASNATKMKTLILCCNQVPFNMRALYFMPLLQAQPGRKTFLFCVLLFGLSRCVTINSLAFSHDSLFLCASSNTETVHIFKLEAPKKE